MCGRFIDPNLRGTELELSELKINPIPRRWNIKPTQDVYVMWQGTISWARWGLIPTWHRGEISNWKASTINARIEEVSEKPTYRDAWRHGRCMIPAGGYYEWTGTKSPKQPHVFVSARNEENLWFAGLVSNWHGQLTCTIMTRAANTSVEPIHDRMPVILGLEEREAWITGSQDRDIGAGASVQHHAVRPFGIRDEGPGIIQQWDGK